MNGRGRNVGAFWRLVRAPSKCGSSPGLLLLDGGQHEVLDHEPARLGAAVRRSRPRLGPFDQRSGMRVLDGGGTRSGQSRAAAAARLVLLGWHSPLKRHLGRQALVGHAEGRPVRAVVRQTGRGVRALD